MRTRVRYRKKSISGRVGAMPSMYMYIVLSIVISFEGLTKAKSPKKPSELICTPNIF